MTSQSICSRPCIEISLIRIYPIFIDMPYIYRHIEPLHVRMTEIKFTFRNLVCAVFHLLSGTYLRIA